MIDYLEQTLRQEHNALAEAVALQDQLTFPWTRPGTSEPAAPELNETLLPPNPPASASERDPEPSRTRPESVSTQPSEPTPSFPEGSLLADALAQAEQIVRYVRTGPLNSGADASESTRQPPPWSDPLAQSPQPNAAWQTLRAPQPSGLPNRSAAPAEPDPAGTVTLVDRAFQRDSRRYDGGFPLF